MISISYQIGTPIALIILILMAGRNLRMKRTDRVLSILSGIIVPIEWDDKGRIIAIALSTYDEEEYLISNNEKFDELIGFLRQEVEVTGKVSLSNKKKSLFVNNFIPKYNFDPKNQ